VRVVGLWRYPVKSMQGEAVDAVRLEARGVAGDRRFGVLDVASGTVVSAKRDGSVLEGHARSAAGAVLVEVPGAGELLPGGTLDAALTRWLGREVRLVEADDGRAARFESQSDAERDDSESECWQGVPGSFVDSSPVHVVGLDELASVEAECPELSWDVRRFRPNVLVERAVALTPGSPLRMGAGVVEVVKPCARCVMTTRAQPGGIARELGVLRHLASARGNELGVLVRVIRPGEVRIGDSVGRLS